MTYGLVLALLAALAMLGIEETSYRESMRALGDIVESQRMRGTLNSLMQNVGRRNRAARLPADR